MGKRGQKWYGPNRAEDINKMWQEYTEELYKKDLRDPDNHDGMITHLEPDILECEVKWAFTAATRYAVNLFCTESLIISLNLLSSVSYCFFILKRNGGARTSNLIA